MKRRPRKPRPRRAPGHTTAHGWGSQHQKTAKAWLALWQPGDPCCRCGQPMWQRWTYWPSGKRVSAIHLDHTDDRTGYLGLSHASCNTAAGNRARRMAEAKTAGMTASGARMTATVAVRPSRAW